MKKRLDDIRHQMMRAAFDAEDLFELIEKGRGQKADLKNIKSAHKRFKKLFKKLYRAAKKTLTSA